MKTINRKVTLTKRELNACLMGLREITAEKIASLLADVEHYPSLVNAIVLDSKSGLYAEISVKEEIYSQADDELKALHGKRGFIFSATKDDGRMDTGVQVLYVPFSCEIYFFPAAYVELVRLSSPWWHMHKRLASYVIYNDGYESRSNVQYEAKVHRSYVIKNDALVVKNDFVTLDKRHYRGIIMREFYPAMHFVYQPFPTAHELFVADEQKQAASNSTDDWDENP